MPSVQQLAQMSVSTFVPRSRRPLFTTTPFSVFSTVRPPQRLHCSTPSGRETVRTRRRNNPPGPGSDAGPRWNGMPSRLQLSAGGEMQGDKAPSCIDRLRATLRDHAAQRSHVRSTSPRRSLLTRSGQISRTCPSGALGRIGQGIVFTQHCQQDLAISFEVLLVGSSMPAAQSIPRATGLGGVVRIDSRPRFLDVALHEGKCNPCDHVAEAVADISGIWVHGGRVSGPGVPASKQIKRANRWSRLSLLTIRVSGRS